MMNINKINVAQIWPSMFSLDIQKIYYVVVFAACLFASSLATAQTRVIGERSIYTQYTLTPFLLHPGAAGFQDYGQVIANYRNTYASFPGSPKTISIGYEGPIGNRIGIGLIGMTDTYAAFSTSRGGLTLSYKIDSPDNKVGFGLTGEYVRHKLNGDQLLNPLVDLNDIEIINRLDGNAFFDAGFGIYGLYADKVIYGLTLPALISQRVSGVDSGTKGDFAYIATLGYNHRIADKDITITPSVYAKQLMFVPFHVDINLLASFLNENLQAGLNYTVGGEKRIGFLLGANMGNFGLNYSYNLTTQQFQSYGNGSHEIGLRLRLVPTPKTVDNM
jgi:type IX secretion system PorP/SprF family membrane protein